MKTFFFICLVTFVLWFLHPNFPEVLNYRNQLEIYIIIIIITLCQSKKSINLDLKTTVVWTVDIYHK